MALIALVLLSLLRETKAPSAAAPPAPRPPVGVLPAASSPSPSITPSARLGPAPVDSRDVESRYDARGRETFAALPPAQQADEMGEIFRDEARALDPGASDGHRSRAFVALARRGAISPAVARSMADLIQKSAQAAVRIDLTQAARDRLDHADLLEALLGRLLADPHEMVRKRAAQGLADRMNDPRVRGALERAHSADPSPFVRDALRRILQQEGK